MLKPEPTPSMRGYACDLLSAVREIDLLDKEQLFVDAMAFYRWYTAWPRHQRKAVDRYISVFRDRNPHLMTKECNGELARAFFTSWFCRNGFAQHPILSTAEIRQMADAKEQGMCCSRDHIQRILDAAERNGALPLEKIVEIVVFVIKAYRSESHAVKELSMTSFSDEQSLHELLITPAKRSYLQRMIFSYLECLPDQYGNDDVFYPFEGDWNGVPSQRILLDWALKLFNRLPPAHGFEREKLLEEGARFFGWCYQTLRTREDASHFLGYMRKFAELFPAHLSSDCDANLRDAYFISWFVTCGFDKNILIDWNA